MSYRLLQNLFSAFLALCGLGLFLHTYDPQYSEMGGSVNSLFYPRFLFLVWIAMSLGMLWQGLHLDKKEKKSYGWLRLVAATALLGLFIVLFIHTGFIISSTIFFILFGLLMGAKPFPTLVPLAALYSIGLYYLFTRVLQISLPVWGG